MTRGRIAIITRNCDEWGNDLGSYKLVLSPEYNGDMYPSGFGKSVYECLEEKVWSEETYKEYVEEFNKIHYHPWDKNEFEYYEVDLGDEPVLDLNNPDNRTFSDYTYYKNISGADFEIITENTTKNGTYLPNLKQHYLFRNEEVCGLYFDSVCSVDKETGLNICENLEYLSEEYNA